MAGFEVRVVGQHALVIKVNDTAPAAKAGVRPGWEIVKIQDETFAPARQARQISERLQESPDWN